MKGINIQKLYQSTKKPNLMLRDTSTTRLLFEVCGDVFGVKQNSSIFLCIYIYIYHGCWRRESNSLSLTFMKLMSSMIIPLKIGHEKKRPMCRHITPMKGKSSDFRPAPKKLPGGLNVRISFRGYSIVVGYCSVSAKIQKISYDISPPLKVVELNGI